LALSARLALIAVLVLGAARAARAQADAHGGPDAGANASADGGADAGTDSGAPVPSHALVPPAPLEMPPIAYPDDAPPLAAPAEVEVIITVDPTGAVTAAEVTRSGGPAADRAVVEGVKRFRFRPATQDGVPIAVRLPFTQRFEPPPPPPAPREPELDAEIEGLVITRGTRAAVAGAAVVAIDPETGRQYAAVTDARGTFVLPVLSGRTLELRIAAAEHERFVQRERLEPHQQLRVKYLLDRKSYGQYESFVRAETDRTEVSRTTLSGPEITRVPGTFGDPFRVIGMLPGVTNVAGLLPLPVVRGSSPGDTGILLDGIRLPLLFHLLAGPSVVHPEIIDHIDFYPGGFPVTYGGYTGGIVDGVTRAGRPDERRIDIDLNLTQTGVLVREPLSALHATATVAGRIGYPGIILSLLAPNVSLSYWDYQARFDVDLGSSRNRLTLFFFGANDELDRRASTADPLTPAVRFTFHRFDLRYTHGTTDANEMARVVFGYDDSFIGGVTNSQVVGDTGLGNGVYSINPQARIHRLVNRWLALDAGVSSYDHSVSNPPAATNPPTSTNAMNAAMLFNPNGFYSESGAYLQAVLTPQPRLRIIPGVRADVYDERLDAGGGVTQWSVDPRLLARYHLSDAGQGNVWLKGVVGRYHQPPRLFLPLPGLDTSSLQLGLLASTQYSVGAEATFGKVAEIDVNTYYNDMNPILFDLTVNPTAADVQQPQPTFQPGTIPPVLSTQSNRVFANLYTPRVGRSYGLEVLVRRREAERLFGWISYTLSRSQRESAQGWQLFDFDRLHVLNLVAGLRLPRNWEFGTRVLFQTGTPLTTGFQTNGARADSQFRVDMRLDKRAVWNRWLLDFYVDIINTTVSAESGGLVGGNAFRYLVPTIGVRGVL
jgi:TonB family protein